MAADYGITLVGKAQRVLGQRAPSHMMMIGGDRTARSAMVTGITKTTMTMIGGDPRVPSPIHPRAPSHMMMIGGDRTARSAMVTGITTTTMIGGDPRVQSPVHPRVPSLLGMTITTMIGVGEGCGLSLKCYGLYIVDRVIRQ